MLLIWIVILGAAVAIFYFPGSQNSPAAVTIQDVIEQTQAGKVTEGVMRPDPSGVKDWYVITGKFATALFPNDKGAKTEEFRAAGRLTEANTEILQKSKKFREEQSATLLTSIAAQVVPFLLIIGLLYFLFIRQLRQAGRGALSFGKSRAKLLTRDREKVVFGDVAGCDEAKEEISEVVEFLKDPKKFTRMGGRMPKGVLMVGAPGHREDPARQGRGRRGRRAILQHFRIGLR